MPPVPERRRTLLLLVAASATVVGFYVAAHAFRDIRIPVADDAFFYVDAVDGAMHDGLHDAHLRARPAFPLLAATLSSAVGASGWTASVATPFAMAAAAGLAVAAMAAWWPLRAPALAVVAVAAALSPITARLVAGKNENLLALWLIVAALAAAACGRGTGTAAAVVMLAAGAGITQWPFLLAVLVLSLAAAAMRAVVVRVQARSAAATPEVPKDAGGGFRLGRWTLLLGAAAAAVAAIVFAITGSGPADAIQTLPPGFRFGTRLGDEVGAMWPLLSVPVMAFGGWVAVRTAPGHVREGWWLLGLWTAVTLLILLVGAAGVRFPSYRALTYAVPFLLAGVAAPVAASTRGRVWLGGAVLAVAVAPAALLWFRDLIPRATPAEVGEIADAASYANVVDVPDVVVVLEREASVLGYRFGRIAAAAATEGNVLVFLGRAEDALAGRMTPAATPGERAVVEDLFERVEPALRRGAPVLVGRALAPAGHAEAVGAPTFGGIAVARGPAPPASTRPPGDAGSPVPPWPTLLVFAVLALTVTSVAGAGWSWLMLPAAPALARAALAPSFGAVAIAVAALAAERVGFAPAGPVAVVVLLVACAASGAAAVAAARTDGT